MYLHEDKQVFKETIEQVANYTGKAAIVIEKDYYVTMILRFLSEKCRILYLKGEHLFQKVIKLLTDFQKI